MIQTGVNQAAGNLGIDQGSVAACGSKYPAVYRRLHELRESRIKDRFTVDIEHYEEQIIPDRIQDVEVILKMEHPRPTRLDFLSCFAKRAFKVAGGRDVDHGQAGIGPQNLPFHSAACFSCCEVKKLARSAPVHYRQDKTSAGRLPESHPEEPLNKIFHSFNVFGISTVLSGPFHK
jgi:hypothetical protein